MHVNIGLWTTRNGQIYRDKTALVVAGRTVSYKQLDERVNRLGSALLARGFVRGDRVALLLFNSIEYVEAFFACAKVGMIAVPLNFRLSAEELGFVLNDCQAKVMLYEPMLSVQADALAQSVPSLQLLVRTPLFLDAAEATLPAMADRPLYSQILNSGSTAETLNREVGGEDVALLMYTSGTTGKPKGVMLTHDNCFFQSVNGWALGISPDVVSLVVLPLFHVGGLNGSVTPILHAGGTVIIVPKFDPAEVLKLVEEYKAHGIMAVPTVYQMLLEHPDFKTRNLKSLAVLISGGAPLPEALMNAYHQLGFEMRQGYGLTESSPGVSGMGPGDDRRKPGSVGRPCLYVDVRIIQENGDECQTGDVGEIIVRGPNIMKGYWGLEQETAAVLKDGWLYTGDLGYFDADGYLYIAGRKKEMIISGGENVYPGEIEQALCNHPDVAIAAVVGRNHELWGEVPVAFVIPNPGRNPTPEDLITYVTQRLARYKVPREVFVESMLPMNAAGKILKNELKKRFQA